MHRHAAQFAVLMVVNHRVVRQVGLMYVSGVWVLISMTGVEGSHTTIADEQVHQVAARLDALVASWREAGHEVRTHNRITMPALDAPT